MVLHIGAPADLREVSGGIEVRSGPNRVVVDQVIAAMGRVPNIECLGLENLGEPLDSHGMPRVDPQTLRIGKLPVYLAGDANAQVPLLHEATDEGHIAGMNALSDTPVRFQRRTPLSIVFCDPQVAVVGRPLADLGAADVVTGAVGFEDQGRARAALRNRGRPARARRPQHRPPAGRGDVRARRRAPRPPAGPGRATPAHRARDAWNALLPPGTGRRAAVGTARCRAPVARQPCIRSGLVHGPGVPALE